MEASYSPYCPACSGLITMAVEAISIARRDGAKARGTAWEPSSYRNQPVWEHVSHAVEHLYAFRSGAKDENHGAHAVCRAVMAYALRAPQ